MAYNLVGVLFNQGSTLLTNMVIARLLGPASFGEYVIVLSTLQSLTAFAGLGMGYTATRYLPEHRVRDPERARRILGLCTVGTLGAASVFALLLLGLAPVVAERALQAPQITPLLRLGALVVLFTAIAGFLTGVLAGLERYALVARAGVISGILYVAICVTGAAVGGVQGAVIGLGVSAFAQAFVLFLLVRSATRQAGLAPAYRDIRSESVIIRRFVIPSLFSGLTAIPALWLAQVALARQPGGFDQLAMYAASYSLAMVVLFLPNVAYSVGMSLINHARGAGSSGDYRSVFWTNMAFTVGVVVLGVLVMGALSRVVLGAYGPDFPAAVPVLLVLLAATIPESVTIAMFQLIQTNDRIWTAVLGINVPRDVLIPVLAFQLAPRYGALGVAIAYLAGRLLACALSTILCMRIGLALDQPDPA